MIGNQILFSNAILQEKELGLLEQMVNFSIKEGNKR